MRHSYIRFVTTGLDKESGRRRGVFQAAYDLVDATVLEDYQLDELRDLLKWFRKHLAIPNRFSWSQRTGAAPKAISWYKSTATEHVGRMHDLCRILDEAGVATEVITAARPGYIVFEDDHQVAAVPFAETAT